MLTRIVNGQRVEVPAAEEAEIRAEWAKPATPRPGPINALSALRAVALRLGLTDGEIDGIFTQSRTGV